MKKHLCFDFDLAVMLVSNLNGDAKMLYYKKTCIGCLSADGLAAMTGAFQALNPGSNPGWRINLSVFRCSYLFLRISKNPVI